MPDSPSKNILSRFDKNSFPWFRFFLGLTMLAFAIAICTPYPLQLINALQGSILIEEKIGIEDPTDKEDTVDRDDPPLSPEELDITRPQEDITPNTTLIEAIENNAFQSNLSKLSPLRIPPPSPSSSIIVPKLPPIIPDGPSSDGIWDINELARGLNLKTEIQFKPSTYASLLRQKPENYRITLRMDVSLPEPVRTAQELKNTNAHLSEIFPQLDTLINENAKVSGFYHKLMERKQLEVRKDLVTLNKILTRHNFYDCDTILEITAPKTGRKALWIQSEMDVVSDGTDGDRLAHMPANIVHSQHYQPFTSYRWKKTSETPNPLLATWQKRARDLACVRNPSSAQRAARKSLELGISDMKTKSFLIAEYDPFIVIPLGMISQSHPFSPQAGDYAVIIYKDKLYPAIVGDAGPRYKIGEASLRIAQELNPKASAYSRPISDLKVSYIVFPRSAEVVKSAPNYKDWHQKCSSLLEELGGISPEYALHQWTDLLAKKEIDTPETKNELLPEPLPEKERNTFSNKILPSSKTKKAQEITRTPSSLSKTMKKTKTPSTATKTPTRSQKIEEPPTSKTNSKTKRVIPTKSYF